MLLRIFIVDYAAASYMLTLVAVAAIRYAATLMPLMLPCWLTLLLRRR